MDQQNNNQAVIPRRSRRLATILPISYWIGIGYSEEDAQRMEELQNDIKSYCDGNSDTQINLIGNRHRVVPHHDMMIPHWQKLAKGLNGHTSINSLTLMGIFLPASVLDIMFPVLQSIDLENFGIINVGLGRDGFLKLSSFIKDNTSIKSLGIGGERIDDLSIASALSDAVKGHPNLKELGVIRSGLNDANILGKVLEGCNGIRELRLAYEEKLGLESMTIIADFIRSNHPLELLELSHCNITDNNALVLASALNYNTNLRQLDLKNNNITEEGEKALLKVMFDPTSMESIVESNYLCRVYTYDFRNILEVAHRPSLEAEVMKINANKEYSIGQKIRKKVVLALCGVDGELFDLSHFNDLPLQLMPRVLELIQEYTATRKKEIIGWGRGFRLVRDQIEKDALSRLFHTLRGWELPLLFENLSPNEGAAGKKKRRKTRR